MMQYQTFSWQRLSAQISTTVRLSLRLSIVSSEHSPTLVLNWPEEYRRLVPLDKARASSLLLSRLWQRSDQWSPRGE